jgi:hypothetical protein
MRRSATPFSRSRPPDHLLVYTATQGDVFLFYDYPARILTTCDSGLGDLVGRQPLTSR